MNQILQKIRAYLFDTSIDINERLSTFFVNIGIVAAILGVVICLLAGEPAIGTIITAMIAVGAPLIASITRHTGHPERYGSLVAVLIIFMIPAVWLTTGAESGGSSFWLLYELFYIALLTRKKQMFPYFAAAILVQAAAITVDILHPELFFHFTDRTGPFISRIGSGVVVATEIILTVYVQKSLYIHEQQIRTKSQDTTRNFVMSIANTIDSKDPYTGGHSRRVAECASAIALRLGMSQQEADNMYFIGLLHDIGKIAVPDRVLNKPGRLTDEEIALIRKHPVYGEEILRDVTAIPHVQDGVLYHHERYDGKGYPEGRKGEEIPFVARVIAVADSYDAMSTTRIYRKNIKREEIIQEIIRCRGTQFDPHIADVFAEMLQEGFRVTGTSQSGDNGENHDFTLTAREMIHRLMDEEQLAVQQYGATNVDNAEFRNLYDYLSNLRLRDGEDMVLARIDLEMNEDTPDPIRLHNCMVDLEKAITQHIRAVDICTRNSESSYLVLLLNAPDNKVDEIVERVRSEFYLLQGSTEVMVRHSVIDSGKHGPEQKREWSRAAEK